MSVHWLVLPVDPEGEPFIAWGSVEADEYRRQPAVYRVEEYVPAEQLAGAVEALDSLRAAWNRHMATCPQHAKLPSFEEIATWMNAPSNTASAGLAMSEPGGSRDHETGAGEARPILHAICARCEEYGRGTYTVLGRCSNCAAEYDLVLSRSHEKPGTYSGAECHSCGCRRVVGHELLSATSEREAKP